MTTPQPLLLTAAEVKTAPETITNIGQLMAALAVGWEDPVSRRVLIAGDGGQFVRQRHLYGNPFERMSPGDIPVDSAGYALRGAIRFEFPTMFRGLFETGYSGDGVWRSAMLTQLGVEVARAGLLDFDLVHPDIRRVGFFNPASRSDWRDLELPPPGPTEA